MAQVDLSFLTDQPKTETLDFLTDKPQDLSFLTDKPKETSSIVRSAEKLIKEGVKPFIGQVPFGKEIAETKPVEQFYEAGARYPKSIFSGIEALQTGQPILPALQKGFLTEKRTPTEISWQMADRAYKKPSTNVAWEFIKQVPFTSAGKLGEIFLDPAVMLTFKGVNKVLLDPAISKFMATEVPAPKWLDTAIQGTIKGFHKPFGDLAKAVKENRIDTITNELYNKFKPQMSELEASYERAYKVKPTENDLKGLIKAKLVKAGIFDKSLVELQKALFKARKFTPKVKITPEPTVTPEGVTPVTKPIISAKPVVSTIPSIPKNRAEQEIGKWTNILATQGKKGQERLSDYLASLTLGRQSGETLENHLESKGLTKFWNWGKTQVAKPEVTILKPTGEGKVAKIYSLDESGKIGKWLTKEEWLKERLTEKDIKNANKAKEDIAPLLRKKEELSKHYEHISKSIIGSETEKQFGAETALLAKEIKLLNDKIKKYQGHIDLIKNTEIWFDTHSQLSTPTGGKVEGVKPTIEPKLTEEPKISAFETVVEPEPMVSPVSTGEIVKRSEIISNLSEKLGVPIRKGHYRQGWGRQAIGIYKPTPDIIRWKSGGVGTVSHEVGHFLDDNFSDLNSLIKANKGELGKLDYSPKKARANEGFSEFLRYEMVLPEGGETKAPKFAQQFNEWLKNHPDIKDILDFTRQQYQVWLKMPSVDKVKSQISFRPEIQKTGIKQTIDNLYNMAIDDLAPIQRYANFAKQQEVKVTDEENPYVLARLFKGWTGKANYFIQNKTFNTKLENTGKGLKEILLPIENNLEDFSTYLVARRVPELQKRGKKTGISTNDAQKTISELEKKYPKFRQVTQEIYEYQDRLMQYAFENGLISPEGILKIKELNKEYVPFYRVFEELQRQGYLGKAFANVLSPIKRIKGSEREIIDPIESIMKNTYAIINAADRNAVARGIAYLSTKDKELGRLVEKISVPMAKVARVDIGSEIKKALFDIEGLLSSQDIVHIIDIFRPSMFKPNESIITVMNNGKKDFYYVDPELYKALLGLDIEEVSMLIKILSYPAKWLRAGATTFSPEFLVRNPMRDQFSAYIYSKSGYLPLVDLTKGIFHLVGKTQMYDEWVKGGGLHSVLVSMDRDYMKKNLKDLFDKNWKEAVNPLKWFQSLSEFGEQGTRLGEFRKMRVKGKGIKTSALSSRDITLDFARMGNKIKNWNRITAFANANIQGLNRPFRAFKEAPATTWWKIMTGITLPSIVLYFMNRDDERYKELPHWQKDLFWIVRIPASTTSGEILVRIPKPFELGIIFGSVPERILEYLDKNDPEAFDKLGKTILEGAYLDPTQWIPTALKPPLENLMNYSLFRDRKLEGMGLERLMPSERYGQFTSETAKKLGRLLGMSPIKIENMVSGYTGSMGRLTLDLLDKFQGSPSKLPTTMENAPIVRGLIAREPIGSNSESVNKFYENYDYITKRYNTINELFKRGNEKRAMELRKQYPEITPEANKQVLQGAKFLSEKRKEINKILDNENIPSQVKTQMIRNISIEMTQRTKLFNQKFNIIRKAK